MHRCPEIVEALTSAGFDEFVLDAVVGNELVPGVTIVDGHHFTLGGVTFEYSIQGDTNSVSVTVPPDCSTWNCRGTYSWAVMITMPGSVWQRVE